MINKIVNIYDDLMFLVNDFDLSNGYIADRIGVNRSTLNRWIKKTVNIPTSKYEAIYNCLYEVCQDYNHVKEIYLKMECIKKKKILLFHGSKNGLIGKVSLNHSEENNDFGKGFYLGDNLSQSMMFVSSFDDSKVYSFALDITNLKCKEYDINREWMLTIAYFRKRLERYSNSKLIESLLAPLTDVDYIIAPIADNRMFMIINRFIDGEITDEQCVHCLSKVNIGYQYVLKSEKAIKQTDLIYEFYFCDKEKQYNKKRKNEFDNRGNDLVKEMLVKYANKGKYISEIFK